MNSIKTARTIITVDSIDWKQAIDGRDYAYFCTSHLELAGLLGFDGKQHSDEVETTDTVFVCEICNGELIASMREWLLDAFSSDDAQQAIHKLSAVEVMEKVKQHFEGGIAEFVKTSVPC